MPMNDMQRQAQQKTVSHGAVVAREYGIPAVLRSRERRNASLQDNALRSMVPVE